MNKKRDPFADKMREWHVMMLPMYPPLWRAERMINYPNSGPLEQSPTFKTEREAKDWIAEQHLKQFRASARK